MQVAAPSPSAPAYIRLRPIALPVEHGGWGMLAAPILAGMALAPSWGGLMLSLAGLCGFLARQPLRLALTDLRKRKRYPRTIWAAAFTGLYGACGIALLMLGLAWSAQSLLPPLALAALLGAIQFGYDIQSKGRNFIPEVCGAAALSLLATAIAEAGGQAATKSWLLAVALALQALTAISYAATRLRLARNVEVSPWPCCMGHVAALAIVSCLVAAELTGWPVALAFLVLSLRCCWGLTTNAKRVKPSIVGLQELGYALLTVAAVIVSSR